VQKKPIIFFKAAPAPGTPQLARLIFSIGFFAALAPNVKIDIH
jgi:hypothetical protein